MAQRIIEVGEGFWNIRGSFKIVGLIDIGTQASLVRLQSGRFVLLDTCALHRKSVDMINTLTDNGQLLQAIINLHPFHTLHVSDTHKLFPQAKLYGTARHHKNLGDLPWESPLSESKALHEEFADDLDFSVPAGVEFMSDNENVHFASVLAWHPHSRTIHVDDTLMYIRFPLPLRILGHRDTVRFHPTLGNVLLQQAGAAESFAEWATGLATRWADAENLCAAHVTPLLASNNRGAPITERILSALDAVRSTLAKHENSLG